MSNLCQYFSTVGKLLLESRVLTEASDVLNNPKIANHPGGRDVVMTAHVSPFVKFNAYNIVLGHNQEFTPVKLGNVRWSAMRNVWILLFAERGTALAIRWILSACRNRAGRNMASKLTNELLDASKNSGNAIRKRDEIHKMAEANKAFAKYRF